MSDHFEVHEVRDFWDCGERVARYHPGFAYRFTDRNREFAQGMINNGVATELSAERHAMLSSQNGKVSGFLKVG